MTSSRAIRAVQLGDRMQSEGSRLADFVLNYMPNHDAIVPYEVRMAAHQLKGDVEEWTELRKDWSP